MKVDSTGAEIPPAATGRAGGRVVLLRAKAAKLIYVPNPKAGSSSIYKLLMTLSGVDMDTPARKALRSRRLSEEIRRAGVEHLAINASELDQFRADHGDHFWFSFARNPYDRAVSNYQNKLNRYAVRFERSAYAKAKLRQIALGPKAWGSHLFGVKFLKEYIPFADFIRGLDAHGIGFDPHFRRQAQILRLGHIRYDFIGKVENFASDIRIVLAAAAGAHALRSDALPRENASRYEDGTTDFYTLELRRIVRRLYRRDFDAFGYPAGPGGPPRASREREMASDPGPA